MVEVLLFVIENFARAFVRAHAFVADYLSFVSKFGYLYKSDLNFSSPPLGLEAFNLSNCVDASFYQVINNTVDYYPAYLGWINNISFLIHQTYNQIPLSFIHAFVQKNPVVALRLFLESQTHGVWSVGVCEFMDILILSGFVKNPEIFTEPIKLLAN